MDITFRTDAGTFNYRAAAIIVHDGKLLVLRDEGILHDYLPGGRIHLREPAEAALSRELREELDISLPPHRLVFMAESFFTLNTQHYHEVCLYYLMDAPEELLSCGDAFTRVEGGEIHHFRWVDFAALRDMDFFPIFLKERIRTLPDAPEFISLKTE